MFIKFFRKESNIMDDKIPVQHENAYTVERDNLISDFAESENGALNRLAKNMIENNDEIIRDYSRTHHRHNRSHTRR